MTTTIDVCDPDVIKQLAMAKARGRTWQIIGEKNNIPANVLDYLPWHLPKEWANACKYAEKLVAHEALAETLAELRLQMKDPTLPARLKTQVSNSIVRIIQQQHALRTPKQPKKATRQPLKPIEQPAPEPPAPIVNEPIVAPPLADTPKPTTKATPLGAVAAVLLFVLMGTFGVARGLMAMDHEPPVRTEFVAHASGSDVVNVAGLGAEEGVLWSALGDARGRGIGERGLLSDPAIETLPETCGGVTAKARNLCGEPWLTVGRFDDT